MASLRRAAERSLRSIGDEEATAGRVAEIAQARPLKRMGLAAVDAVTRSKPDCVARSLGLRRQLPALEEVGDSWQTTVYRLDDKTVLKVLDTSIAMTRRERKTRAARMRDEHAAYRAFLGPAVLPHDVDVGPHPFEQTSRIIRITQPYCEVDYLKLGETVPRNIPDLATRLGAAQASHPNVLDEIDGMVLNSRALYDELNLSTDLIGEDNMGIAVGSGAFTIIDGQPVTTDHPGIQEKMNRCFDNLEAALAMTA